MKGARVRTTRLSMLARAFREKRAKEGEARLYFPVPHRETARSNMRLGLLGPAGTDVGALGRAAEFLLNGARVHRAIYLGNDGALDRAVAAWARKLVGDDPSDDAAWRRAADVARRREAPRRSTSSSRPSARACG